MLFVFEFDFLLLSLKSLFCKKMKFFLYWRKKIVSFSDCDCDSRRDKLYLIFSLLVIWNVSDDEIFELLKLLVLFVGFINYGNICYVNVIL